eukprot:6196461-Pleurochrysis_carterae.AAC.1
MPFKPLRARTAPLPCVAAAWICSTAVQLPHARANKVNDVIDSSLNVLASAAWAKIRSGLRTSCTSARDHTKSAQVRMQPNVCARPAAPPNQALVYLVESFVTTKRRRSDSDRHVALAKRISNVPSLSQRKLQPVSAKACKSST